LRKDQEWIFLNLVRWLNYLLQTAMDTTIEAVQIHGGNGYVAEYHVERARCVMLYHFKYMRELQKYNEL
jgi:hypothetical protein